MPPQTRREFLGNILAGAAAIHPDTHSARLSPWTDRSKDAISPSLHVANRLTFGARAEDLAKIEEMGIRDYIDWQLQYESIPDPIVANFVAANPILGMNFYQIASIASRNTDAALVPILWGRMVRAAFSERQLYEKMVEFWSDHFSIPIADYVVAKMIDDREVIRKYALGKFHDLLKASATSPVMLHYLSNNESSKENPNENYARELMELHTLGLGNFTERDVREVARAFTGWTTPADGPSRFLFAPTRHDREAKVVLGVSLPAGRGQEDGLAVLDILAHHPATAHFICQKLVRRFVSDQPPAELVESAATVFLATAGDLRQVMRHILNSAQFMASAGQKYRPPIDYMAALLRLLRANVTKPQWILDILWGLGQVPFNWFPPNGYPDNAGAWMSAGTLLTRWNVGFDLVAQAGRDSGVDIKLEKLIPTAKDADELADQALTLLLQAPIAPEDRAEIIRFIQDGEPLSADTLAVKREAVIGLVLASPYFQWY